MASPQSQPQLWNECPPEILGLILSNLGKHDLLNARMVSHAWNDESLSILRKSKFTQILRVQTIVEYMRFITPTTPEPGKFIIPFHLNFEIDLGVLSLNALIPNVESLCQIFGPDCVSTFTFTANGNIYTEENIRHTGVIEFLTLISTGLTTLDLTRLNFKIDFLQNQIIKFPNLKKMICNTSHCESEKNGPEPAYISIIENSPKLEDLTLTHICELDSWPLDFSKLKALSLESMINPQDILDKILASSGPPVLRELSLLDDIQATAEDKLVVHNILQSVSTTLKSFKLRQHMPLFLRRAGNSRIMRFPKLPHLEHLGLEYNVGVCHKYVLSPEDINLNEEIFPSLKSIELPIGFKFTPALAQSQENIDTRIEFPNLIKLILRVNSVNVKAKPGHFNDTLEHLLRIFPTPSKLFLVNVGENDGVEYVLERIMKSNWSKNIQEFGMIGFRQDYLGQVLDVNRLEFSPRVILENCGEILEETLRNDFQNILKKMRMESVETVVAPGSIMLTRANQSDSVKMTNITTIKLELIDVSHDTPLLSSTASTPNLSGMVKYFPKLRMIEVSELLFHSLPKIIRERHIMEFKSNFPGVVLNVT